MAEQQSVSTPHPYDILQEEAFRLLFTLNGKEARPEASVILQWIMSHRWALVKSPELAEQIWNDLSALGDGTAVQSAVDAIVELTMRVLTQFHYFGIYEHVVDSFLKGQAAFRGAQSVHEHLWEKLPYTIPDTVTSGAPRQTGFNRPAAPTAKGYEDFIRDEPWVMVCTLLLRSGFLQRIMADRRDTPQSASKSGS